MAVVVDASVILAWCLNDEQPEYAEAVVSRFLEEAAIAPSVWPTEMANGLLVAERRGRLSAADAAHVQGLLSGLPVEVQDVPLTLALGPIMNLARLYDLSAYDASYLELAMRQGLALATIDAPLRAAAERAGVRLAE